jgi:uncharacterized membrane protein YkoI
MQLMRFVWPMLVSAAGILSVASLAGAHGSDYEEAFRLRERREILPLEELIRRAGLNPDARILEIESEFEHGRRVYEIEYLDPRGRIREVLIDAGSGEVLTEMEN